MNSFKAIIAAGLAATVGATGCSATSGPLVIREPVLPPGQDGSDSDLKLDLGPLVDGRAYGAYLKSQAALRDGDINGAIHHLKTVLRRDPWATQPRLRLAGLLLMLNRPSEAGEVLAELQLDPVALPEELLEVYVAFVTRSGEHQEARRAIRAAYERGLLSPILLLRWVSLEETRTPAESLLDFVSELRGIRQDEPVLDCLEGHLRVRLASYRQAQEPLDRCLDEFPKWLPGMLEQGIVSELLGDPEAARTFYEQVLVEQPGQALAVWRLRVLTSPDEEDGATRQLEQLLAEVRYETALQLAALAIREGDDVRAEAILNALPRDHSNRPRALILRGPILEDRGQLEDAEDSYEQAFENSNLPAIKRVAALQWVRVQMAKDPDKWESRVRKFGDSRGSPEAAMAAGLALADRRTVDGIAYLEQAVQRFPNDAELYYRLGVLYEQEGSRAQALEQMESAIAADPDHADALNFLGYSLAEENRELDRAETLVRRALELRPDAGYIMDSVGWILFMQGKADEAIPWLEKALDAEGDDPVILEHLGDAYAVTGRDEQARQAYQAALQLTEISEDAIRIREKILRTHD